MSPVTAFVAGLFVMLMASAGVLYVLRISLHQLLLELCEQEHRARFWGQLYGASVVLTVGLAALCFPPPLARSLDAPMAIYSMLPMMRAGLIGLLVCLGILAMTMVKFIARIQR